MNIIEIVNFFGTQFFLKKLGTMFLIHKHFSNQRTFFKQMIFSKETGSILETAIFMFFVILKSREF